jgi:Fe-S-cluster containining protein
MHEASRQQGLRELWRFHAVVDRLAHRLERRHADRLQCRRGCSACCVDGITVFGVEAESIRRGAGALLARGTPHARGQCAFLDEDGACRIYEHRPYVCRTQGLPLRWLQDRSGETVELRDICPLNEATAPIEELPEDECWTLGVAEARLARIQRRFGGRLTRVGLRELFRSSPTFAEQSFGAERRS